MKYYVPLSFIVEVEADTQQAAYDIAVNAYEVKKKLSKAGLLLIAELDRTLVDEDWLRQFSRPMTSRIVRILEDEGKVISVYLTPREAYVPTLDALSLVRERRRELRDEEEDQENDG